MAKHADTAELSETSSVDTEDVVGEHESATAATKSVAGAESDNTPAPADEATGRRRPSTTATAITVGVVIVIALGSVAGWLGYRVIADRRAQATRAAMIDAARQGAVDLTSIDYTRVDADIQRILDASTGTFRKDFQDRSKPFVDVVKQAQSKSEGTVTAAGLESQDGDTARVLVTVSVKTSNVGAQEQQPRAWRMLIDVQNADNAIKVSDVQFVP
ncbi:MULTISPECIES: mammalian cell entry protein [unclassified Mycobacterium]|uniref:mammalian cell entry protein n=1 Tax=unclassified Mycobacterium TaxID=2642494 RepID=UPI0029C813F5|nr:MULTISPECIES: mammalian cell entry protein [unclassified Mycobacterium]